MPNDNAYIRAPVDEGSDASAWLRCDLVDDHDPAGERMRQCYIGFFIAPGRLPRTVACPDAAGVGEAVSLNEVREDAQGRAHLTRAALLSVNADALRDLLQMGELQCGEAVVRMLPGVSTPQERLARALCEVINASFDDFFPDADSGQLADLNELRGAVRDVEIGMRLGGGL